MSETLYVDATSAADALEYFGGPGWLYYRGTYSISGRVIGPILAAKLLACV